MFIVVEGPNGAGKTTLIKKLAENGYNTLSSPMGTPLAKMLRPVCRGTNPWENVDKTIQFLLFSAARYDEYINLVQNNKDVIIADRWWTSTYVYQCLYQGIDEKFLRYTIHHNEKIDMVILLSADTNVLIDRVFSERQKNPAHGICTWTKDKESQYQLISLYENELPKYLDSHHIRYESIDTTHLSEADVTLEAITLIEELKNGTRAIVQ